MTFDPEYAIEDLEQYLGRFNFKLSEAAEIIFKEAEKIGHIYDFNVYPSFYLYAALKQSKKFKSVVIRNGGDPIVGSAKLLKIIEMDGSSERDWYGQPKLFYSTSKERESIRARLIDLTIESARRKGHTEIKDVDIIEALLELHDEEFPPLENEQWTSSELKTNFNTLSHITGNYVKEIWVGFDDVRRELGLLDPISSQNLPVESAPLAARPAVLSLLVDYPDYHQNCFLIMSFQDTPTHTIIHKVLKSTLKEYGLNLLRADDKAYSDDLATNIEAYLHGCGFAIAVYEKIANDAFNPNVALEVGYLMGLKKPVCLLKDKSLETLNTDLVGKLYIEFDPKNVVGTIPSGVEKWLADKRIIEKKP
jgi:hypothetical protein